VLEIGKSLKLVVILRPTLIKKATQIKKLKNMLRINFELII